MLLFYFFDRHTCIDLNTEVDLGPCQTTMMGGFCESNEQLKAVNYFHQIALSQIFGWVPNAPLTY